jgi:hypothetical protein
MVSRTGEYTLEFLLDFDGRRHWYEGGYSLKFEIRRVAPSSARPHGLRYSFTLHDGHGKRLVGFDNAHIPNARRPRGSKNAVVADHWHRTAKDRGRPYVFVDAATLLDDFFRAAERVLTERGVALEVLADEDDRRTE